MLPLHYQAKLGYASNKILYAAWWISVTFSEDINMLSTADILNLIRLNELDLQQVYLDLESDNKEKSNNAGEIVFQTEELSKKLRKMYEDVSPDYAVYPKYEDYIKLFQKS